MVKIVWRESDGDIKAFEESDGGLIRLRWFGESLMRILCLREESDGGLMRLRWFGESLMGIYCHGEESDGGLIK